MKLRRLVGRTLACLALLQFATVLAIAEYDSESISWIEGRLFDTIGTDHRSVSFMDALGEHVAEVCNRYLKVGSHEFPKRIVVTLRPQQHVAFDGDYQIRISPGGQVSLDFRWDESLSFETVCLAFTEAYILNYARFNYGIDAVDKLRSWALLALASRSYLSLRPAQRITYINQARSSQIVDASTLFSQYWKGRSNQEWGVVQGYLMLQALRESTLTDGKTAALIEMAVAGLDVTERVAEACVPKSSHQPAVDLENWWQSQTNLYLASEHEFCESMDKSKLWLEAMSDFEQYRAPSGGRLEDLTELWDYRNDEAISSMLSARCEIIRLRIEQVNPAYFNVAVALGALYETVLEAENKHRFISAFAIYLNEWGDARQLHSRVSRLVDCDP